MHLCGLLSVVNRIQMMAVRDMSMMPAFFMRSFFVMSGRLLVVAGRVFVMFSGLLGFRLGLWFLPCLHCESTIRNLPWASAAH